MHRTRIGFYIEYIRGEEVSFLKRCGFILFGALLVAVALQLFLVKNYVIDGGVIGISIILSYLTHQEVGLYLLVLNTPFFLIAYSYFGKRFLLLSLLAILTLSTATYLLEPFPAITNDPFLVIVFGGMMLGLGVGMIIRFGGCLDGTEVMAILFSSRFPFSIGQYVLMFNFLIFGCSIFILGLYKAVFSLATFIVASKTIDWSIHNQH